MGVGVGVRNEVGVVRGNETIAPVVRPRGVVRVGVLVGVFVAAGVGGGQTQGYQ